MKKVKNIFVGFVVSFIGSIPLGYLNFTGWEIYSKSGLRNLILYLLGVVFVEAFVIYLTLLFAQQLALKKRLKKIIDFFGIGFMFLLAYLFYYNSNQSLILNSKEETNLLYPPFVLGVLLNCFNFLQLPFWSSWNLYLVSKNYIATTKMLKMYYLAGTLFGTFLGMISLIVFLQTIFQKNSQLSRYLMPVIIPLFFIILGGIHVFKVYKKYYKSAVSKN